MILDSIVAVLKGANIANKSAKKKEDKKYKKHGDEKSKSKSLRLRVKILANKILQSILEFISALIKALLIILGPLGCIILVAVIVVTVTVGVLAQEVMATGKGFKVEQTSQEEAVNITDWLHNMDWNEVVRIAESYKARGKINNRDLNAIKFMSLCYRYVQVNKSTKLYPETLIGMSLNETGLRFFQNEESGDIYKDFSNIYQGYVSSYPGYGAIGPLQLDSSGKGYGSSYSPLIDGLKPTKDNPLGERFNVDCFIPYAVARTYKVTDIDGIIKNKTDKHSEGYYMYEAMKRWGIKETEDNVIAMANMWMYTRHWVPYKFSSAGQGFIGGSSIGGAAKWCRMVGDIACAIMKEGKGDIFAIGTTAKGFSISPASLGEGTFHNSGILSVDATNKPIIDGITINECLIKYFCNTYSTEFKDFENNMKVFRNTQGSDGGDRTMAATAMCPIAGRQFILGYLSKIGINPPKGKNAGKIQYGNEVLVATKKVVKELMKDAKSEGYYKNGSVSGYYSQSAIATVQVEGKTIKVRRDCSGLVYGVLNLLGDCSGSGNTGTLMKGTNSNGAHIKNWKVIGMSQVKELQPGDVLINGGHAEIYAGNDKVYSSGGDYQFMEMFKAKCEPIKTGEKFKSAYTYVLRKTNLKYVNGGTEDKIIGGSGATTGSAKDFVVGKNCDWITPLPSPKGSDGSYWGVAWGTGYRWGSMHQGWDIAQAVGSWRPGDPIQAVAKGKIYIADLNCCQHYDAGGCTEGRGGGYGNFVMQKIEVGGKIYYVIYGHMLSKNQMRQRGIQDTRIFKEGQTVEAGTILGYVGSSGASQGAHLHFQICTASNMWHGAISPLEFYDLGKGVWKAGNNSKGNDGTSYHRTDSLVK